MVQSTNTEKIRFLRGIFKDIQVSRDANDVAVSCPNCKQQDKKKLSISISTWKYHCWVCGIKGANLKFLFKQYHSPEVTIAFAEKFGIKDDLIVGESQVDVIVQLPDKIQHVTAVKSSKNPDHKACYNYLVKRGITEREMWYWKILVSDESKFSRRVIIPSFDADGDLNYYVSRSIDKTTSPRYVNAKTNKTEIIFNDIMVDWSQPVVLVEGVFDAIPVGQNAIPLLGSYLPTSSALFNRIVANDNTVILGLDPDVIDKTHKISSDFHSFGIDVYHLDLTGYKDLGEMPRDVIKQRLENPKRWMPNLRTLHKISKISSGSIL
jgi:DNA primase